MFGTRPYRIPLPAKLKLEASSICQLKCPSCPTAAGFTLPVIGEGFLRLEDFRTLIELNPQLKQIELSNYGEILLNPELERILEYAHRHGVDLSASNGVNLNTVKEGVLEAMVKFGLRSLTCSIDGASQESYGRYRRGGDFDTVIRHIEIINAFKRKYGSAYPMLQWQFIVFGHNENEIEKARQMAEKLQMRFLLKLSWDGGFSPVSDAAALRRRLGAATREEYKSKFGHDYMQAICHQLWDSPQINWDGRVLGCSRNFWGEFGGNAFSDGLERVLNGSNMIDARKMLLGRREAKEGIPCSTCAIYLEMKRDNKFLRRSLPGRLAGRLFSRAFLTKVRLRWNRILSLFAKEKNVRE